MKASQKEEQGADEGDDVEIWPQHADAVTLFLACATQWRSVALQVGRVALVMRTGLDYAVLPVVGPLAGVTLTSDVFGQLRMLEAFAKEAMAEADKRRMAEIGA